MLLGQQACRIERGEHRLCPSPPTAPRWHSRRSQYHAAPRRNVPRTLVAHLLDAEQRRAPASLTASKAARLASPEKPSHALRSRPGRSVAGACRRQDDVADEQALDLHRSSGWHCGAVMWLAKSTPLGQLLRRTDHHPDSPRCLSERASQIMNLCRPPSAQLSRRGSIKW